MINKSILEKFYNSGLSIMEIASKLEKSQHEVFYWMEKYKISRRSWSEATYVKRNPYGDPFKIKANLSLRDAELKGMGLGIFWGEGSKNNKSGIIVGNTDSRLILKFIEFLTKICGVKKEKLTFSLTVFNDMDSKEALKFWISKLKIEKKRFGKLVVIPPQGQGTYRKKSKYGVLAVNCFNTKLRKWLDEELGFHS